MADELREYLVVLFKMGKVNDQHISLFLTEQRLKQYEIALTSATFNEKENNEYYEFLGDGNVGEFVPYYISKKFPDIKSPKWLTRLKHNLVSKKYLADLCIISGLEKFVKVSQEVIDHKNNINSFNSQLIYRSALEDAMEAFIGCTIWIVEDSGKSHGVANQIIHNILTAFYDKINVSLEYYEVFDAITRLKELYESNRLGYKWPSTDTTAYEIEKIGVIYNVKVYGWPLNDKKPELKNRVLLAYASSDDRGDAKQRAAYDALKVLTTKYGIKEYIPSPYEI